MFNKNIPHMGCHLIMDFCGIQSIDLNNFEKVFELLKKSIELSNANIINYSSKQFEPQGLTIVFTLSESHMSIHTWPEHGSCAIDFYNCGEDTSYRNCQKVCEYLKQELGESNVTSEIIIPRGQSTLVQTNNYLDKCELFKNVNRLHMEQSPFQKIEVYDTPVQGKVLLLDRNIQVTDLEISNDNYTLDITKQAIDKQKQYENVLIIGGGDLRIATHLLQEYQNIKKISVCELDERVYQVVRQFFQVEEQLIKKSIEQNKLTMIFQDGVQFVKDEFQKNNIYDGVILDVDDYSLDASISKGIFNQDFFQDLYKIMSNSSCFGIRLSFLDTQETVEKLFKMCGFQDIQVIKSATPEYGGFLPIAVVQKRDEQINCNQIT